MKVILLKDVAGTGEKGQVKEVATGYARNFLIPKGLAKLATTESIEQMEKGEKKRVGQMERELKDNQKKAGKLDGMEIEIKEKTNDSGTLYSAIGVKRIAQEIKKQHGVEVKSGQIELDKGIKECGEFNIRLKFPHGLEADLRAIVSTE